MFAATTEAATHSVSDTYVVMPFEKYAVSLDVVQVII